MSLTGRRARGSAPGEARMYSEWGADGGTKRRRLATRSRNPGRALRSGRQNGRRAIVEIAAKRNGKPRASRHLRGEFQILFREIASGGNALFTDASLLRGALRIFSQCLLEGSSRLRAPTLLMTARERSCLAARPRYMPNAAGLRPCGWQSTGFATGIASVFCASGATLGPPFPVRSARPLVHRWPQMFTRSSATKDRECGPYLFCVTKS